MPGQQPQTPVDPDALAKSLGGSVGAVPATGRAPAATPDPDALAKSLGGAVALSGPMGDVMNRGGKIHTAATGAVIDVARGFDPRTTEGRQNLIAGAGGAAGALATGGLGVVPWIARVLGSSAGAASGGMMAEAGEQIAGNKPVSTEAVGKAGLTQGAYELAGKAVMWPLRWAGTRFAAVPRVAREAKDFVEQGVRNAKTALVQGVDDARDLGRQFVTGEQAAVQRIERGAAKSTALDIDAAKMKGDRELADARAIYDELLKDSTPDVVANQRALRAPINPRVTPELPKGASQRALDALGAKVGEAAQNGPPIAIAPLQQTLNQMATQSRPAAIFNVGGKTPDAGQIGFLQTIRKKLEARHAEAAGIQPGKPGAVLHGDIQAINQEIAKELGVAETHPLPGILGRIALVPDGTSLSFADAHQLKKLLDESVNFDRTANKHVEQITKGLRGQLREMLSVHKPYNAATEAFQRAVPLYRKGVGKRLIDTALNDPDKAIRVLDSKSPARAQAVKDLVLTKAAEGGDAAQGQQAWHALQSQFVFDKIIRGGPEDLSKRLSTVLTESPEFAKIVLGDPTAQRVLSNIDHIGQAYKLAEQQAGELLINAKAKGATTMQGVKDAGARRLSTAQQAAGDNKRLAQRAGQAGVDRAQETARDLSKSRLAAHAKPLDEQFTGLDVARAVALPNTVSGVLAIMRLMAGPRRDEIVQWAAHSQPNTQRLVRALNSQLPATAVADLARELAAIAYPITPAVSPESTRATNPATLPRR